MNDAAKWRTGQHVVKVSLFEIVDVGEEDDWFEVIDIYENDHDTVTEEFLNDGLVLTDDLATSLRALGFSVET